MCNKCQELERRSSDYEDWRLDNDQATSDSINNLIKKTEAKKAALHPEQQKG